MLSLDQLSLLNYLKTLVSGYGSYPPEEGTLVHVPQ